MPVDAGEGTDNDALMMIPLEHLLKHSSSTGPSVSRFGILLGSFRAFNLIQKSCALYHFLLNAGNGP